jgi:hypothetical protein
MATTKTTSTTKRSPNAKTGASKPAQKVAAKKGASKPAKKASANKVCAPLKPRSKPAARTRKGLLETAKDVVSVVISSAASGAVTGVATAGAQLLGGGVKDDAKATAAHKSPQKKAVAKKAVERK